MARTPFLTICVKYRPADRMVDLYPAKLDKEHQEYWERFQPLVQPFLTGLLNRPMDGAFKSQLWALLLTAGDILERHGFPPLMVHTVNDAPPLPPAL